MGTSGGAAVLLLALLATATAAVLGAALARERRLRRRVLGERGWLVERERAAAAEAAVAGERARIARELHDIVSHHVGIMVVQSGAAREVLGTAAPDILAALPDGTVGALAAVEAAGRAAMAELRQLLGLLAPAPDGTDDPGTGDDTGGGLPSPPEPQPGLDRLGALVDRIAFAGLPVEVRVSGDPRPLPAGVDLAAYRIVQEALTNALKHGSPGATAEVAVRYADRALRVEVLTTGPSVLTGGRAPAADGAGRGLLGLRERVAVYGGDLDARRRLGGGYRVRARIPLDPP